MEICRQAEIVDRIIFYIEKNFRKTNCFDGLHGLIVVDCPKYEKVFLQHVSLSIHEYIIRLRTEQAIHLLERTQLEVEDVAVAVGINGIFEFAHVFEKQIGISPCMYRNQVCMSK
ncbi:MAG: helix-turn-helix domain-containing protein [Solibacillus sp.]